ncbi:MAG: exonuclease SbcCD subunit D [Acidobacteriota bacterium]|nr:exonuclease SbcCD subunit D [Blastocatellia bacterium]MDW8241383.1 exonuclease SbcCD subunit D [Acidobacteriota bacterium]
MKFIHTADWHLGRFFYGVHLTDDQAHVLDQLVDLVKDAQADALLVAGDIYDRAIPPVEAIALLDDVLSRIVKGLRVPVVLIAGNHDSAQRLGFGSRLLAAEQLHIVGLLPAEMRPIVLHDEHGPVFVHAIPYVEPAEARQYVADRAIDDHDAALRALLDSIRARHGLEGRNILVTHAFVAGGQESESERPLSVGGAGTVKADCLAGFDYVALGHLHRPQTVGDERIHYAGSLLKYSFSEADHIKSVNLVEMDERGRCRVQQIRLTPRRDVRCITGYLAELLQGPPDGQRLDDYLMVTLLDTGALLDAMGKLRQVYQNVLHIQRAFLMSEAPARKARADHRQVNELDLFSEFYWQMTGERLSQQHAAAFSSVLDQLRQQEAER